MGIASGEVYVGLVGSMQRCEYAMIGPSVNLAARLMGKAPPWHVLVTGAVRDAASSSSNIQFCESPAVEAKGYDAPIRVHEPHLQDPTNMPWNVSNHSLMSIWEALDIETQFVGKIASIVPYATGEQSLLSLRVFVHIMKLQGLSAMQRVINALVELEMVKIVTYVLKEGQPHVYFLSAETQTFLQSMVPDSERSFVDMLVQVHKRGTTSLFGDVLEAARIVKCRQGALETILSPQQQACRVMEKIKSVFPGDMPLVDRDVLSLIFLAAGQADSMTTEQLDNLLVCAGMEGEDQVDLGMLLSWVFRVDFLNAGCC